MSIDTTMDYDVPPGKWVRGWGHTLKPDQGCTKLVSKILILPYQFVVPVYVPESHWPIDSVVASIYGG